MPQDFDQIAAAPAKGENIAGVRIGLERLRPLHPKRQTVHAATQIGRTGGDLDAERQTEPESPRQRLSRRLDVHPGASSKLFSRFATPPSQA